MLLYRHRVSNLLLTSVLPGPKEQTPDELQRFLRPVVNDLKRLWRDGISIQTPSCLPGESTYLIIHSFMYSWASPARLVRVALVAVVCDKPAAHKMGGFGSHSHTRFCTRCKVKQSDLGDPASYNPEGT